MKKKRKKQKAAFERIRFIFDEFYIDVGLGRTGSINFMGLPIEFRRQGKTMVIADMSHWLIGIADRLRADKDI